MSVSKEGEVRFLVSVRTLQGNFLTFPVSEYRVEHGALIKFVDRKTGMVKRFSASSVEIQEVRRG